jgi:hypothetical protein
MRDRTWANQAKNRNLLHHIFKKVKVKYNCVLPGHKNESPELDYTGIADNQLDMAHALFETVASVLGSSIRSKVCRKANFYELGGNSLNSVFTVTSLRQKGYVIGESNGRHFSAGNFNCRAHG